MGKMFFYMRKETKTESNKKVEKKRKIEINKQWLKEKRESENSHRRQVKGKKKLRKT